MGRIILLDPATVNQIAAGEVVERPAAVVKELVENALDAGATRVSVEIAGGGLEYISVTDNGSGMDEGDALLAFERHATSKIRSASDLLGVGTLGFRGEALPSIAAVSRLQLSTRAEGTGAGYEVTLDGGDLISSGPAGVPAGTTVIVRELFFNTPARLKFIRSPATEATLASETCGRLALSRPDVAFSFKNNGRLLFQTTGNGRLRDAIAAVFGTEVARTLLPVKGERSGIKVDGYTSPLTLARSSRRYQVLTLNGRYVKSYLVSGAVDTAYRGLLTTGRHPIVIMHLTIGADGVDVNVHPAKLEVRVADHGALIETAISALRQALDTAGPPTSHIADIPLRGPIPYQGPQAPREGRFSQQQSFADAMALYAPPSLLRPLGFIPPTYIVASGPDGLYIVDQHAAHERILYEEYLDRFRENDSRAQILAIPLTFEATPNEQLVLEEHQSRLARLGFEIEGFGGDTYILRSVPQGVTASPDLIKDMIEHIAKENAPEDETVRLLASCLACRSAVKAGDVMSSCEMQRLLDRLMEARHPATCPHGRPTFIRMTTSDLARRFLRE